MGKNRKILATDGKGQTPRFRVNQAKQRSDEALTKNLNPAQSTPPQAKARRGRRSPALFIILLVILAILLGSIGGYSSGKAARQARDEMSTGLSIQEQYELGLKDLEEGRFEIARQRFEFVLSKDSSHAEATIKLAEALKIIYATATPTELPPTVASTPTLDPRPLQELFAQAKSMLSTGDWEAVIDALTALRKQDRSFQPPLVDGMLYLALRSRGMIKILQENNLEGGLYDLALAENFGPLDAEAISARDMARLYLFGLAFWEAIPEQAIYYFAQIASISPYFSDASGWTAMARYRASLIHYGDQLATNGDWCSAQSQYEIAQGISFDESLQVVLNNAIQECLAPQVTAITETPTLTPTITLTPSPSPTIFYFTVTPEFFPSPTLTVTSSLPSETPTPSATPPEATPTPSPTVEISPTPLPSDTPAPPEPTPTPTGELPTVEPTATSIP